MSTKENTPPPYQKPKSLVETVTDYLRESILNGALKPEQRLNNKEIMSLLGISNIPLREAVRILEQEGLIQTRSGRGYWVTAISHQDLREAFEVREMMETFAIALIERRAQSDERVSQELDRLAEEEKKHGPHPEPLNFHAQLLQLTQNQRLINAYALLSNSISRYQRISFSIRHRDDTQRAEHTPIITALRQGRYGDAQMEIRKHLQELAEELLNHLGKEPGS